MHKLGGNIDGTPSHSQRQGRNLTMTSGNISSISLPRRQPKQDTADKEEGKRERRQ
jgi:hypothetical protein